MPEQLYRKIKGVMMSRVGFIKNGDTIKEYLPKNGQLTTEVEKRIMFFNLYNYYVEKEMRLTKMEMLQGENIYTVFKNKIDSLSKNSRLERRFKSLIEFNSGELLFDLDDMFLHLVYERAKLVNKSSRVQLFEDTIIIKGNSEEVSSTLLIPAYTQIDKNEIYSNTLISEHLKTVLKTLKDTQIRQVFLVYPKHPKFMKHITIDLHDKIKLRDEEYRVKMIPYSFSFCTRARGTHCSTKKSN